MKTTALIEIHRSLGAKIVPFAGFEMPLQYEGVNVEHETVRKAVGVFDVSHMGEIWIKGPKAFDLVQKLTTNDVSRLSDGKVQYSCMTNDRGGIVDDLLVYRFDAETYLLVVNAANTEKDFRWITQHNTHGAIVENASDQTTQLAIQGPFALATLQKLTPIDLTTIPYYTFKIGELAGVPDVIISATGYTGEKNSFEIYFPNSYAVTIWNAVMEAGKEFGIKPIGLGARDTLRLEMGYCLYGNDIDDTTSPIEAGLGWITKFTEGNHFIHREYHEQLKNSGVAQRLRGFELIDRGIPRQHYEICDNNGNNIGRVTSGAFSPILKKSIGMGYIRSGYDELGSEIYIKIRDKLHKAIIVKTPFYQPS